nr:PrsW family intramembrane metalloprotease [Brevibacterium otitidis]
MPEQRSYAQPWFSPTVTQEMRMRAQLQQHRGGPSEAVWVTQAIQRQPELANPEAGADIARLVAGIALSLLLGVGMLIILVLAAFLLPAGPIVILLASVPLAFILLMVWWFDRWKPQPIWLLISCLLWGAVASIVMTLLANAIGFTALALVGIDASGDVLGAVVFAPLFEESTKGIFLVAIVLAARKYFEGPLDGWVYGSLIGAGFAFTENLLYLSSAFAEAAVGGLAMTFIMRGVLSPLLHSTFVICHGLSIGLAARRGKWWLVVIMWFPGLLAGIFLHALWNGMATASGGWGIMSIVVILGLSAVISGFWLTSGLVLRRNESIHTRQSLGDYANAGWLTHGEVDMLGTWKGRRAGKRWANQFPGARPEMNKLIRKAADLATIRTRVLAGVGGEQERKVERYELDQFIKIRTRMMKCAQRPQGFQPAMPR